MYVNSIPEIRMMRVKDWVFFYPLFPLMGAFLGGMDAYGILLAFLISFFLTAYGFSVNNIFDINIDSRSEKKAHKNTNPISTGDLGIGRGIAITLILLSPPIALFPYLGKHTAVLIFLTIAVLTLYSIKKIRLKERPYLDFISHGLMFGFLPFVMGITLTHSGSISSHIIFESHWIYVAILAFLAASEALLFHQMEDYEEDRATTCTTVVRLGIKKGKAIVVVHVILTLFIIVMIAAGGTITPLMIAILLASLGYPLFKLSEISR